MAEKTEAPTPRRRDEARAKGQGIGRSWEFSMGLTLGVGTLALGSLLPGIASALVRQTQNSINNVDPHASSAELMSQTGGAILTTLTLILPLALLVMVAGVAGNLVSGGLVMSLRAIRFDPSRINPMSGLKRMVDRQVLVRLGLSVTKLTILALISWQVVGSRVPSIINSGGTSAANIAASCLSAIFQLGLTITILLAVVALVDFVVQRRKAQQSIRMTKEEVRQEYRESEGDPQVRGARKRRARQIAFARMMDAVPTSDVIVTNPTTLAVALKYDSLTMRAPRIVAKGQRLMAERIKNLAREHNVPIVEDKPLARALFPRPIGAEVPAHLYRAVAKLLVLVHQARFAAGRGGQRGTYGRAGNGGGGARPRGGAPLTRTWWPTPTGNAGQVSFGINSAVAGATGVAGSLRTAGSLGAANVARAYGGQVADMDSDPEVDSALANGAIAGGGADWLLDTADEPTPVDEDALALAMAQDELADVTAEELDRLEAARQAQSRGASAPEPDYALNGATDTDEEPER